MAEIKWSDIFDLSGDQDIKEAVKVINTFSDAYKKFLGIVNKDADKAAKTLKALNTQLSEQSNILKSLNPLLEANKQIIQQSAVTMTEVAKSHKQVNKELKDYKTVATEAKKASDNLDQAAKKIKGSVDAEKGSFASLQAELKKANKERDNMAKSINGRLNPAFAHAAENAARLQSAVTEQRSTFQQAAKTVDQSIDSYFNLNKELVEARKRYKGLSAEERKNSKEAKNLMKSIQKLDKELKGLDKDMGQSQRNVGDYAQALKGATGQVIALASASALVGGALDVAKDAFAGSEEGSKAFNKALNTGITSASGFFDALVKTATETENLDDVLGNLTKNFDGLTEKTEKAVNSELALVDAENELRKKTNELSIDIAKLNATKEILSLTSDDNTKSLQAQIDASNQLIKVDEQITAKELELAKTQFEIAEARLKSLPTNIAAQQAFTDAKLNLIEVEKNALLSQFDARKNVSEKTRDQLELELDILLDVADRKKSINERVIDNDKLALETRQQALDVANKDIEKSFLEQAEVIQKMAGFAFNVDDFISEDDTTVINERLKQLQIQGADEITINRFREVIIERLASTQDLIDAQATLTDAEAETLELQKDIENQEKALNKTKEEGADITESLADLEKDRLQTSIDLIQERLKAVKDGSIEELELKQELNDLLLEQTEGRIKSEIDLEKGKTGAATNALDDFFASSASKLAEGLGLTEDELGELGGRLEDMTKETFANMTQAFTDFSAATLENKLAQIDHERELLDLQTEAQIEAAGGNAEQIALIEEKTAAKKEELRKKEVKARRKAAIAERIAAVAEIIFNTAVNITSIPFPLLPVLGPLVAGLAAVQTGLVLAAPLPQFAVGTDNAPKGQAIVNEKGREISYNKKTGKAEWLGTGKGGAEQVNLSGGEKIFTAKESKVISQIADGTNSTYEDIINNKSQIELISNNEMNIDYNRLQEGYIEAMKALPSSQTVFDERGFRQYEVKKNSRRTRVNKNNSFS